MLSFLFFQSDTGTNYYKEIPLSEILAVETTGKKTASGGTPPAPATPTATEGGGATATPGGVHCFEIRTANVDFYVGETSLNEAKPVDVNAGTGSELARQWEMAIRAALMPVVQANIPHGSGGARGAQGGGAGGARGGASGGRSGTSAQVKTLKIQIHSKT